MCEDESATRAVIVRHARWQGLRPGDPVAVNVEREYRRSWTFVAFARNERTGEEWVEVRGGRVGESKGRAFRPELIYPIHARHGARFRGLSFRDAPQLDFD